MVPADATGKVIQHGDSRKGEALEARGGTGNAMGSFEEIVSLNGNRIPVLVMQFRS